MTTFDTFSASSRTKIKKDTNTHLMLIRLSTHVPENITYCDYIISSIVLVCLHRFK